jgi:hypothetical protein
MLTPVALAHLIMGDGQLKDHGLTLCTDCYPIQDVVTLLNVLVIRYGLVCSLHQPNKGHYRIYIQKKSLRLLDSIVRPYMAQSMLYKINLKSPSTGENNKPLPRATRSFDNDASRPLLTAPRYYSTLVSANKLTTARARFMTMYSNPCSEKLPHYFGTFCISDVRLMIYLESRVPSTPLFI